MDMRIKGFLFEDQSGEVLSVPLSDPVPETGLLLYDVDGIAGADSNVNIIDSSFVDGGRLSSVSTNKRVINLSFLIENPNTGEGPFTGRHLLYDFFAGGKKVKMTVNLGDRSIYIEGYVESNPVKIFSPKQNTRITIVCEFPYFREVTDEINTLAGSTAAFEFPFSNEDLFEPLIEFGVIQEDPTLTIDYKGNVSTGFQIDFFPSGPTGDLLIYDLETNQTFHMFGDIVENIVGSPLRRGDVIRIDSRSRQKAIVLERGGQTINLINARNRNKDWLTMSKGVNRFSYEITSGGSNARLVFTHQSLFEGV